MGFTTKHQLGGIGFRFEYQCLAVIGVGASHAFDGLVPGQFLPVKFNKKVHGGTAAAISCVVVKLQPILIARR